MRFLTDKIRKLDIGWNERPLSEADVYGLCARFDVVICEEPLLTDGFYFRMMGKDFIAIDSGLPPTKKLFVLLHELGHLLFHVPRSGPTVKFHAVGRYTRTEREADVFALCGLVPRTWIERRHIVELIEEEGLSAEMLIERLTILDRYGI